MEYNYYNIPEELIWTQRWCVAGPDNDGEHKAPYTPNGMNIYPATTTKPHTFRDFESAVYSASVNPNCGIGYVLTAGDGYTVLDLDVKNKINYPNNPELWTTQENIDRFGQILKTFDSYTELSRSGQGLHIWIKGTIPGLKGIKRDGVEVYCQERFIICTGVVIVDKPIEDRQELLEILVHEISLDREESEEFKLVETTEKEDDHTVYERARSAANNEKFERLAQGHWQDDYPSQSEADLSLMSMFAFYSDSNEQCRRLFRMTELGKRDKSNKNNVHLDRNLRIIRARQQQEQNVQLYAAACAARLAASAGNTNPNYIPTPLQVIKDDLVQNEKPLELPEDYSLEESELTWPPGVVGDISRHIFEGAPRPVKEVAIVAALGLVAGICGRAWCIPQSGLNLYIVLIARSAIGKEAMHSGISGIINSIRGNIGNGVNFVDFSDYASGPALTKAVTTNPSFVNVSGEWGRKIKRLAMEDGKEGPMQSLRTAMTNLYQKSGPNSIVGGIGYSDKEKNVASISGAAYSMIGETTPRTFYDALTEQMMEDGFMSRFTIVEYNGERPESNLGKVQAENLTLKCCLIALINHALVLNGKHESVLVESSEQAGDLLYSFDKECDNEVNGTDDEAWRQMWNRAHLKAYRIAALLAVATGYIHPIISLEQAQWAIDLIRRDINIMRKRIDSGDVGSGDNPRELKLLSLIKNYIEKPVPESYKIPEVLRLNGVVPRKYLQMNVQKSSAFTQHRMGANFAIDATLKSLVSSGYLIEVAKNVGIEKYQYPGVLYHVVNLPS
jgi:hypothetical protein